MKLRMISCILLISAAQPATAQNIGIGNNVPTRAKLEVHGVAGSGNTNALFSAPGNAGISLQQNWPTIGFNQYRDITTSSTGKYMANGYASLFTFDYTSGKAALQMFNSGLANQFNTSGYTSFTILNNGNWGIRNGGLNDASLWISKAGNLSAFSISGSVHTVQFAYDTKEDTHIRGGKDGSRVIINDIPSSRTNIYTTESLSSTFNVRGSISYSVKTVTGNYTLTDQDRFVRCDLQNNINAKIYIALPTPTPGMEGRVYTIFGWNIPNISAAHMASGAGGFIEAIGSVGDLNIHRPQTLPRTGSDQYYKLFQIYRDQAGSPHYTSSRSCMSFTCVNGLWIKSWENFQFNSNDIF